ncbi:hypothetical protein [Sulfurimonas sp.]
MDKNYEIIIKMLNKNIDEDIKRKIIQGYSAELLQIAKASNFRGISNGKK